MIFVGASLLAFISLALLAVKPRVGLLVLIVVKPVIDATWNHGMFGINALRIVGAGVPILIILRFFLTSDVRERGMPMLLIWLVYVFVNFISFGMMVIDGKMMGSLSFILRILNGFVGFYMFQIYYPDKKWFRRLLIAFLLAGLFPMLMGVYQAATGQVWQLRKAVGLVRNVGVYHDAFAFRSFAYMTITAIILYWSYFTKGKSLQKFVLMAYGFICSLVIYKIYSKAGIAIYAMWTTIWTVLNKKIMFFIFMVLAALILNFSMGNKLYDGVARVFQKEVYAIEGVAESKYVLGGRMTIWEDFWTMYLEADAFGKMFGLGIAGGRTHNDYLRVLVGGGIVGLFVYVLLLSVMGLRVLRNLFLDFNPLSIMAFMIFMMWMLDTIGLSPGLYPAYQWYIWGFVGLALRGVEGLADDAETDKVQTVIGGQPYQQKENLDFSG